MLCVETEKVTGWGLGTIVEVSDFKVSECPVSPAIVRWTEGMEGYAAGCP